MKILSKYSLPIAAALLLLIFFLRLPPLRSCALSAKQLPKAKPDKAFSHRLDRFDALIMAAISLVYSVFAFMNLGNTGSVETFLYMGGGKDCELTLDVSSGTATKLMVFEGVGIGSYTVSYTTDGVDNYYLADISQTHAEVLKWHEVPLNYMVTGGTIKIRAVGNVWLGEVVALDAEGRQLPFVSAPAELCDEAQYCPERSTYMDSSYFDEIYHARTAWEQLNGVYPYEITHPPLGKLIIGIGISLFGMTPFGWRFSGTFLGVLMLPILYIFAKKLYGGRAVPAASSMLFALDFMHFVQTRIATIDVYAVFFILLMYLFMYLFLSEGSWTMLALCGVCFGLGAASKWTCIYAGAGLALLWLLWVIEGLRSKQLDFGGFVRNALFCVCFFILVPCAIYYLSYIPYGRALNINSIFSADYLRVVLDNQSYMFNYHSDIVATHPYSSRWYQWMLDIRPILYYLDYYPEGYHVSFGAFLNPIVCWGGLLCLPFLVYLAAARHDRISRFIIIGYLAQLLPWVLVSRLTFEYHYFPCVPFLVLAIGRLFSLVRLNDREWKLTVWGMVAVAAAVFLLFYPSLAGLPVSNYSSLRSWLPTWPF